MPSLASIDIGSNTIRLLIGKIENKKIVRQRCEMTITRLAAGINGTGVLNAENIEKSISVLKEFSRLISKYKVTGIKAVGTSALREAKNSKEFISKILSETGIKTEVISGHEEAELTAKGVLFDIQNSGSSFIVDIGGGSTEWIFCKNSSPSRRVESPTRMGTIPTGVVKLFDSHIKSDPPSKDDRASLKKETGTVLDRLKENMGDSINSSTVFIGTAGTITTLAAIDLGLETYNHEKIHAHKISLKSLYEISERLLSLPLRQRKKLRGLEPERADLIIPGILFTINIMETLGVTEMFVSDNGLLEGVLLRLSGEVSH